MSAITGRRVPMDTHSLEATATTARRRPTQVRNWQERELIGREWLTTVVDSACVRRPPKLGPFARSLLRPIPVQWVRPPHCGKRVDPPGPDVRRWLRSSRPRRQGCPSRRKSNATSAHSSWIATSALPETPSQRAASTYLCQGGCRSGAGARLRPRAGGRGASLPSPAPQSEAGASCTARMPNSLASKSPGVRSSRALNATVAWSVYGACH